LLKSNTLVTSQIEALESQTKITEASLLGSEYHNFEDSKVNFTSVKEQLRGHVS